MVFFQIQSHILIIVSINMLMNHIFHISLSIQFPPQKFGFFAQKDATTMEQEWRVSKVAGGSSNVPTYPMSRSILDG